MTNQKSLWLLGIAFYILIAIGFMQAEKKADKLQEEIKNLKKQHEIDLLYYINPTMTVTAYTACESECDDTPNETALMKKPIPGKTVAVSRDRSYMLGKDIWIEGIGQFRVNDVMNKKHSNRLDIVVLNKEIAKAWGKQKRRVVVL